MKKIRFFITQDCEKARNKVTLLQDVREAVTRRDHTFLEKTAKSLHLWPNIILRPRIIWPLDKKNSCLLLMTS